MYSKYNCVGEIINNRITSRSQIKLPIQSHYKHVKS